MISLFLHYEHLIGQKSQLSCINLSYDVIPDAEKQLVGNLIIGSCPNHHAGKVKLHVVLGGLSPIEQRGKDPAQECFC